MTVTSGFFNSVNHDRLYDAEQISSMFDGIITDGIYQGYGDTFEVMPVEGMNNTVTVGTGRAWFNHTWTLNDAPLVFTLESPNTMLSRIDAIVIDINKEDSTRKNQILKITGEYAESDPAQPILINNELHKQYPLAYISVPAGQPGPIKSYQITNMIGTASCPLVAGLFETMDLDVFIAQMNSDFDEWFSHIQSVVDDDAILNLQNQIDALAEDIQEQSGVTLNVARDYSTLPYTGSYNNYSIASAFYSTEETRIPSDPDYNNYFNVQSYIDETGTCMFLIADSYSSTRIDYKLVKVTKDGSVTTTVLKQNARSGNANLMIPMVYSGICKGHDGNIYGMICAYSGSYSASTANDNTYYIPLTVFNLSQDSPVVVYEDTAGSFSNSNDHVDEYNNTETTSNSTVFFYNEKYSIYVFRIGQPAVHLSDNTLPPCWYRFTTSFSPILERKPMGLVISPSRGDKVYVALGKRGSSDHGAIYLESLNPSTWTSSVMSNVGVNANIPVINSLNNDFYVDCGSSLTKLTGSGSSTKPEDFSNSYVRVYKYSNDNIDPGLEIDCGGFTNFSKAQPFMINSSNSNSYVYDSFPFGQYTKTIYDWNYDWSSNHKLHIYMYKITSYADDIVAFPVVTSYKYSSGYSYTYDFVGYCIFNVKTGQSGIVIPNFKLDFATWIDGLGPNTPTPPSDRYNGFLSATMTITNDSLYSSYISFRLARSSHTDMKDPIINITQVHFNQNM